MEKQRILVVEDELSINDILTFALRKEGYEVRGVYKGQDAIEMIDTFKPDLVLLDIMLPDKDGFQVCREICDKAFVIILTARNDAIDKILGIEIGADDYITKPFNPLEVVARVKTQLRRYMRYNNSYEQQSIIVNEYDIKGLIINKETHKCSLFGKEVALTPIEFSILWYLCEHQGKVVPSEELFEAVWGEKYLDNNNTVMAHIGRLREKIHEPSKNPKFIKTVWGVGYTIEK